MLNGKTWPVSAKDNVRRVARMRRCVKFVALRLIILQTVRYYPTIFHQWEIYKMATVEKLSITLPSEMVSAIKERVEAGDYASTSEVLRDAMRNWMRQEEEHSQRMKAIKARIQSSLDDTRPAVPVDEVRRRLKVFYAENQTVA
jgi:antitoxin ParD1/3/4